MDLKYDMAFDKFRFIMTYSTILGVTEIICSLRLVLEGKTGKKISESWRLEFLKVFSKQFCFIRCRRQYLQATELRRYSRFTFVKNTIGNSPKATRAHFLGSDGLCSSICRCKFGSFKNHFATITCLSELYFRFKRFILLVHTKKVISMNYGSSTSSSKPWRLVRLDLILMRRDRKIHQFQPEPTHKIH